MFCFQNDFFVAAIMAPYPANGDMYPGHESIMIPLIALVTTPSCSACFNTSRRQMQPLLENTWKITFVVFASALTRCRFKFRTTFRAHALNVNKGSSGQKHRVDISFCSSRAHTFASVPPWPSTIQSTPPLFARHPSIGNLRAEGPLLDKIPQPSRNKDALYGAQAVIFRRNTTPEQSLLPLWWERLWSYWRTPSQWKRSHSGMHPFPCPGAWHHDIHKWMFELNPAAFLDLYLLLMFCSLQICSYDRIERWVYIIL